MHDRLAQPRAVGPDAGLVERVVAVEGGLAVVRERVLRPGDEFERLLVVLEEMQVADRAVGQPHGRLDADLDDFAFAQRVEARGERQDFEHAALLALGDAFDARALLAAFGIAPLGEADADETDQPDDRVRADGAADGVLLQRQIRLQRHRGTDAAAQCAQGYFQVGVTFGAAGFHEHRPHLPQHRHALAVDDFADQSIAGLQPGQCRPLPVIRGVVRILQMQRRQVALDSVLGGKVLDQLARRPDSAASAACRVRSRHRGPARRGRDSAACGRWAARRRRRGR
jgi:hypothetical protein